MVCSLCSVPELARAREWDSVVTCHASHRSAHTWNVHNHTIGRHKLKSQTKTARPLVQRHMTIAWLSHDCHMAVT